MINLKIQQLNLLAQTLENANFGLAISSEVGELLYENADFALLLSLSAKEFLKRFPPGITKCPFVFRNHIISKRRFLYNENPCFGYFVFNDPEKKKLLQENIVYRDILEHIDNGVVLSDKEGYICFYNKPHAELDGFEQDYVLGKHLSEIYRVENHTRVLQSKKAIQSRFHYYATINRDHIPLVTGTYPCIDKETNEVLGVYSVERDISAIRELQQKVSRLEKEVTKNKIENNTSFTFEDIIGESEAIKVAINDAKKYANSPSPVLIYGETGTGKELFAQSIHNFSPNFREPFVAINCAAVPENLIESTLFGSIKGAYTGATNQEGLFLSAKHGTLFLDEVNSMTLSMQTKMLRALQEKKVRPVGSNKEYPIHCRILSSCNAEPEEALKEKVFRSDLYYRLAVMRVDIPPLRQRIEDVVLLAHFFAEKYAASYRKIFEGFSDDFIDSIQEYNWPGNVRELEFAIEGCIALLNEKETQVMAKNLPVNIIRKIEQGRRTYHSFPALGLPEVLAKYEEEIIIEALENNKWNITQAAKSLHIQRQNLQQRMKKLGIKKEY